MNSVNFTPTVIEEDNGKERHFDIFSRLLRDRIVMVTGEINDNISTSVIAQLLYLEADDPDKDIFMYINSPGGSVISGMAMVDTMNFIKPDVSTICVGVAASMGSFILSAGARGKRFSLPNSRLLYHQVMSGINGGTQYVDMAIEVKETEKLYDKLNGFLSDFTYGKITKEEMKDKTDRNWWMSPEDGVECGFIDAVITSRPEA